MGLEDLDNRIVITGMGVKAPTPRGLTIPGFWNDLREGVSGIALLDPPRHSVITHGGLLKGFNPDVYISKKDQRRIHPSAQMGYAAAKDALTDSGLLVNGALMGIEPQRIGIRIGSGVGGATIVAGMQDIIRNRPEDGDQKVPPYSVLQLLIERGSAVTSLETGAQGPAAASVSACATGSTSIIDAMLRITDSTNLKLGRIDAMVAGGDEASVDQIGLSSFFIIRALSKLGISRPFDEDADGFVMSEGAGVVVLERLSHALARNARIYAEVAGYGETSDAHHETMASGVGSYNAMGIALERACLEPKDIDYTNAHGTSTDGDKVELDAIGKMFGDHAEDMPTSSSKSMTGHMMGAAGVVEVITCILAINNDEAPPTINLYKPIRPDMNLVPLVSQKRQIRRALNNSFGFGGINSCLVLTEYPRFENDPLP